jgi:peptidoglycan/xylan/chitin deacetylase (PgdA/CDA1 family)
VSLVRRLVAEISRGVGALRPGFRPGLRVLLYHSVGARLDGGRLGLSGQVDAFAEQICWLRQESGLAIVSLTEGVARLTVGGLDRGTAVAVTFDDGFRDTLTVATPVLERYAVPFTAFVTSRFLTDPPTPGVYLDAVELRALAGRPLAAIGAHGHTHRPLSRLDDDALLAELRLSSSTLAEVTGASPTMMSYPHGAVDGRVVRSAAAAGFRLGSTSLLGVNRRGIELLRLCRTEIDAGDGLAAFIGKVRGDYDWYRVKQRVYWPVPCRKAGTMAVAS